MKMLYYFKIFNYAPKYALNAFHLIANVLLQNGGNSLNGCCEKLASHLNAKVGLFVLSDPRQHKQWFFNFHKSEFIAPLIDNVN